MNFEDPPESLDHLWPTLDFPSEPDEEDPFGRVSRLVESRRSGRWRCVAARVHTDDFVWRAAVTLDEDPAEVLATGEHDCGVPVDLGLQFDPRSRQKIAPVESRIVKARQDAVGCVDDVRTPGDTGIEQRFRLKRERVRVAREALRDGAADRVEVVARPGPVVADPPSPADCERPELSVGDEAVPHPERKRA